MKRLIRNGTVGMALAALMALAGCSYFSNQEPDTGYAVVRNEDAAPVGNAVIEKSGQGVKVELTVSGLPPADYGVQIYDGEKCIGPGFDSIGAPAVNVVNREPGGPQGLFPNFLAEFKVGSSGTQTTSFTAEELTFSPGPKSLFAPGGMALVIDRLNPAETYGKHVACGAITRSEPVAVETGVPPGHLETAEHAHELGNDDMTFRQPAEAREGAGGATREIQK